jgi:hypothetical protein
MIFIFPLSESELRFYHYLMNMLCMWINELLMSLALNQKPTVLCCLSSCIFSESLKQSSNYIYIRFNKKQHLNVKPQQLVMCVHAADENKQTFERCQAKYLINPLVPKDDFS